jgi:hypothetical protein
MNVTSHRALRAAIRTPGMELRPNASSSAQSASTPSWGNQRVQRTEFLAAYPHGVQRPASCPRNGTYVTWLHGSKHVAPALCLRRQFASVQSLCPLLLVFDDLSITADDMDRLKQAYGAKNMIAISTLRDSIAPVSRAARNDGRRLYQQVTMTLPKLWVWALPAARFPLLFYLDLDILVTQNIDDVFEFEFNTSLAAVPCPPEAWPGGKTPRFNAGVALLRPSLRVLSELRLFARWASFPWNGYIPRTRKVVTSSGERKEWYDVCAPDNGCRGRSCLMAAILYPNESNPLRTCRKALGGNIAYRIEKACAPKIGDQSIHNAVFRNKFPQWNKWTSLEPLGINVDARDLTNLSGARLIHFLGEPKPWAPHNMTRNVSHSSRHGKLDRLVAYRQYRDLCADLIQN